MSVSDCCLKGFRWEGTPTGRTETVANIAAYVAGTNKDRAILLIPDLFGWTFNNNRLLADHYAAEADATVYLPDFFHGEILDAELIKQGKFAELGVDKYIARNSRELREPEIFAVAKELRVRHKKVGAVGFCYGGWAVMRLGAKEHQPPLVDCVVNAHPSLMIRKDVDEVAVPVQVLAPEVDMMFDDDFKAYTFQKLIKSGQPFVYEHFPGVEHGCFVRGDESVTGERAAMVQAKESVVTWFRRFLG